MKTHGSNGRRKRALVTGGMGFIGSHLAAALLADHWQVTALDDLSTGTLDNIRSIADHPGFQAIVDTVVNAAVMEQLAAEADVIFHLAAAVGVQLIIADPLRTLTTNIAGTEAVLRAAAHYGVPTLLASTSEVYGKSAQLPFAEDGDVVLGPTSRSRWSYAASKMVDEFLALGYYRQYQLPVVVFRLFNTVGPRQTGQYGMVVPRFVQAALRGQALTVYGDGQQSRCFMHVDDAVAAITGLAECPAAAGQVFNIGSTESVTILELARRVLAHVYGPGDHDDLIRLVPYHEAYGDGFEDMRARMPDTSRLRACLSWAPHACLDDILDDVIASLTEPLAAPVPLLALA